MRLPTTPVSTLSRSLRDEARQHYRSGRIVIAVDGPDGGGQAAFADALAAAFAEEGVTVLRAHTAEAEDAAAALRDDLVAPFRAGVDVGRRVGEHLADHDDSAPPAEGTAAATHDAVLLVDGTGLHASEVRGLWNWSVWLEVAPAVAAARVAERDGTDPDPDAESTRPARERFRRYVHAARPRQAAAAIVENSDAANPVQIFGDFC